MLLRTFARCTNRRAELRLSNVDHTARLWPPTVHPHLIVQSTILMSEQQSSIAATSSKLKRSISNSSPAAKKQKTSTEGGLQHLDYTHVPADWLDAPDQQDADHSSLQLTYRKGNMLADAPKGCVLVHACNTQGHWGAGIAKAFKAQYPKAYAAHHKFCTSDHTKSDPVRTGTAQLLRPQDNDQEHWIGCVFTSAKYGKGKDKPEQIIKNTSKSMQMLLELISQVDDQVGEVRMCKINSGKFGVPWEETEETIKGITLKSHWRTKIEVWEPED